MTDSNVIDLFAAFSTNKKAEKDGVETTLPGCGDTKFLIARAGNATYKRLLNGLYKRHRAVIDSKGEAAEAKSDEILAEVYAKAILLGWAGTLAYKGKQVPYSYEVAHELLSLNDFRAVVETVSQDFNTFKSEQDEADLKN